MSLAYFCGWAYAIFWGVSFYPTLYLNYKLKTSDSISLDYIVLNILGYLCYSVSIFLQLYNQELRIQYMSFFAGRLPVLSGADLFYSIHGLILLLVLFSQIIFGNSLWKFHNERLNFKLNALSRLIFFSFSLFVVFSWCFSDPVYRFFNFVMSLSYFKILISLVKNIPQAVHNHKRKTMYGVSRLQILFDFLGVLFSFTEFYLKNDLPILEAIDSNRGKVGITCVTFFFSSIYLFQIYIYGTDAPDMEKKEKVEDHLV